MKGIRKIRADVGKLKQDNAFADKRVLLEIPANVANQDLKPPERKRTPGRPSVVRPRSRMEYISDVKRKTRAVDSLYGIEGVDAKSCWTSTEIVGSESKMIKRPVKCSLCHATGHNRSKCKQRGM